MTDEVRTRVVVALGGNALLERGESPTLARQRARTATAAACIAPIARDGRDLVVTHGNGPHVGLLALQAVARGDDPYPLDVLGAETEGMIGYLIEQELRSQLPRGSRVATILTQAEVDTEDPAFAHPTKFVGPSYERSEAEAMSRSQRWQFALDGDDYRRVVASPQPLRIVELDVIELLLEHQVVVVCAGGGGIPVVMSSNGNLLGVEAVIDKDASSSLLAQKLAADVLLLLTDVDAVYAGWRTPDSRAIRTASPTFLRGLSLPEGSMRPKVRAACDFVEAGGRVALIGRLSDAGKILAGLAGTSVTQDAEEPRWWR